MSSVASRAIVPKGPEPAIRVATTEWGARPAVGRSRSWRRALAGPGGLVTPARCLGGGRTTRNRPRRGPVVCEWARVVVHDCRSPDHRAERSPLLACPAHRGLAFTLVEGARQARAFRRGDSTRPDQADARMWQALTRRRRRHRSRCYSGELESRDHVVGARLLRCRCARPGGSVCRRLCAENAEGGTE
jgi:hypothetical protein